MQKSKSVDDYIANAGQWQDELKTLRKILLSTELEECIKWGGPCYMAAGKNIVGLSAFKAYFGLWFHQGALLKDASNKLVNAQEGKTRALRQWRMRSASDIKPRIIKRYVEEAISNANAGREIAAQRAKPLHLPVELKQALEDNRKAGDAFARLRLGLQREYAEFIRAAKRTETKQRRLAKILPLIKTGVGLNDKYR